MEVWLSSLLQAFPSVPDALHFALCEVHTPNSELAIEHRPLNTENIWDLTFLTPTHPGLLWFV
jgi:hypothetical protein